MAPQELWEGTDKATSLAILAVCLLRLDRQHLMPLPLREGVLGFRNTFPYRESVAQVWRRSSEPVRGADQVVLGPPLFSALSAV